MRRTRLIGEMSQKIDQALAHQRLGQCLASLALAALLREQGLEYKPDLGEVRKVRHEHITEALEQAEGVAVSDAHYAARDPEVGGAIACDNSHDPIACRRLLYDPLRSYIDATLERVRYSLRDYREMEPFEAVQLSVRPTHEPATLEDEVEHDVRRAWQPEVPSGVQQAGREWLHVHEYVPEQLVEQHALILPHRGLPDNRTPAHTIRII